MIADTAGTSGPIDFVPDLTGDRPCPRCHGSVFRVHRRVVELLISRFVPIQRYRCQSRRCGWEGNRVPDRSEVAEHAVPVPEALPPAGPPSSHAQLVLDSLGDAVLSTDLLTKVRYLNQAAEQLTGWSAAEAAGRPLADVCQIIDSTTREAADDSARRAIAANNSVGLTGDFLLLHRDGSESAIEYSVAPLHESRGRVVGAVITVRDAGRTGAIGQGMTELLHHDALTGLPNRLLLAERLAQAIGQARRHRKQVALLFLELDCLEHVNESLGHEVGDRLLAAVAGRLKGCVRSTDTACRIGGDEFVILLAEIAQPQDAMRVATKLLRAFATPHAVAEHQLQVTLSIGISVFPESSSTAAAAPGHAETAMYRARRNGGNAYQFFRADMNTRAARQLVFHGITDTTGIDHAETAPR